MVAFLPWVFPPVVVATFGRLALFGGIGPLRRAAEILGFGNGRLLLQENGVLLCVAVLLDAWRTAPFVALLLLGVLSTLTGGGFFFHTVTANEFRWELVTGNLSFMGSFMPLLFIGGLAFVILGLRTRPAGWWLAGTYLAAAVATAFLIGKIGSDVNYLLELSAALALAIGALVSRYPSRPTVRSALLLALAVQVAIMVQASQFTYARFQAGVIASEDGLARLEEVIDDSNGPILADEYAGLLPLEGLNIYLQPFEMTQLQRDGRWDQRPLLASIERRKFPAILIWKPPFAPGVYRERWTREMLDTMDENYRPTHKYAGTLVYRPRPDKDVP